MGAVPIGTGNILIMYPTDLVGPKVNKRLALMPLKQLSEHGDNQCGYAEIQDNYSCSNLAWIVHT